MTILQAHGFASMNGGTTGGSGGASITVSTGAGLQAAINSASGPLTIFVQGTITPDNSSGEAITIDGRNDISIIGTGMGGELDGIGIHIKGGSSNLIVKNLKIHDVGIGPKDAIGIEGPSKNIWIDSNELYSSLGVSKDFYDGLLDIKRGAEYITVSNNYFHDHHKVSLVGYSDADEGGRYVTYDHNRFENVGSRVPSVRDGYVHVYENYYEGIQVSGINLRMGAVGLIENNVFVNSLNPIVSFDSATVGFWDLRGNVFQNSKWSTPGSGEAIATSNESDTASYNVPYSYAKVGAGQVHEYVLAHAGTGHADTTLPPVVVVPPVVVPPSAPAEGTSGNDLITGNGAANSLKGGAGNDTLNGGAGNDKLDGGTGNDVLDGGTGNDSMIGGSGDDVFMLDSAGDVVIEASGGGRDTAWVSVNGRTVSAHVEITHLHGGATLITGGKADETIFANANAGSEIKGEGGNDLLWGGRFADTLRGGAGNDTLSGGAGNDSLDGGADKDVLNGGDGQDRLIGGARSDTLTGGAGDDVFVYSAILDSRAGSGADLITDFTRGDRIDLSGLDANARASGQQDFVWIGDRDFSGAAGELRVEFDGRQSVVMGDIDGDRSADLEFNFGNDHRFITGDFLF